MGNWQLEVGRMALYIAFPVVMFTYFNQPQYFEDWVIKTKREMYHSKSTEDPKKFEDTITSLKRKQELKLLNQLEAKESS
ncbi:protein PET100 homolog, mitochondrial-like [Diabrotica virgifera virgifera]|uniref:Protein PET100 homolog, mitochondrial-like n=1 Tax=Diabrotica virgifera virgifera TaxID=50390 RepID=A0A6P7F6V9_DIAVI|nr:protein PET100 homolog, mitochondrial-like [Diabrotica virgifera virgifera]